MSDNARLDLSDYPCDGCGQKQEEIRDMRDEIKELQAEIEDLKDRLRAAEYHSWD